MPNTAEKRTLFISDEAFEHVLHLARMSGYVHGRETARGLGEYVTYLMTCQMKDARPDDVRSQDDARLRAGYAPEWQMYTPRKRRVVRLDMQTLARATAHCLILGISYGSRSLIHAPNYIDSVRCMSALLEAIGTEWVLARIAVETET